MKFAGVKGIIDRSGQQLKVREAQFSATLPGAKHDKLGPLGQSRGLCNTWKRAGCGADVQRATLRFSRFPAPKLGRWPALTGGEA